MLIIDGGHALSQFRTESLHRQLESITVKVEGFTAKFVHFIQSSSELNPQEKSKLEALLLYIAPASKTSKNDLQILVTPRFGTISPWSSKATDIAHNCGLTNVQRIERGTLYEFSLKASADEKEIQQIANVLHDRMTETVLYDVEKAKS